MSDQLENQKREAEDKRREDINNTERNFLKELEHIRSIHKMEKEQIEHRANKAISDLQNLQIDHSKLLQNTFEREDFNQVESLTEQIMQKEMFLVQLENQCNLMQEKHQFEKSQLLDKIR